MPIDVLIREHHVVDTLPWRQQGPHGRYDEFHEKLEEDVGKWHIFEVADGVSMENVRGAILSHARTMGWEVTTSKNGRRLAARRIR